MTIDYDALTSEIVEGMKGSDGGVNGQILKCKIGDSILGRFILHRPDPKNSVYNYKHHGWKTSGGVYVSYLCPTTNGVSCPICKQSIQMWQSGDAFLKEQSKKIRRKENWITNFYVIDNTKNPKQSKTMKLFRYGTQVKSIVDEALEGEDKEIFGKNIWRLDEKGCNFRINVKPNSDKKDAWPSYTSSKFLPPSDMDMSDSEVMELLDSTIDPKSIFDKEFTPEELVVELQKNFLNDLHDMEMDEEDATFGGMKKTSTQTKSSNSSASDEIDDLVYETTAEKVKVEEPEKSEVNDEIEDLLAELD